MNNLLKLSLISIVTLGGANIGHSMMMNKNQIMQPNFNKENMMNGANMVPVHQHNNSCVHNNNNFLKNNVANGMQIIPVQNNIFNNLNNQFNNNGSQNKPIMNGNNVVFNNNMNNNQVINQNMMNLNKNGMVWNGMNQVPVNNNQFVTPNIMNCNNAVNLKIQPIMNGNNMLNINNTPIMNSNNAVFNNNNQNFIMNGLNKVPVNDNGNTVSTMNSLVYLKEEKLIDRYKNSGDNISVNINEKELFLAHISRAHKIIKEKWFSV